MIRDSRGRITLELPERHLIERLKGKESYKDIAKKIGCCEEFVTKYVKKNCPRTPNEIIFVKELGIRRRVEVTSKKPRPAKFVGGKKKCKTCKKTLTREYYEHRNNVNCKECAKERTIDYAEGMSMEQAKAMASGNTNEFLRAFNNGEMPISDGGGRSAGVSSIYNMEV